MATPLRDHIDAFTVALIPFGTDHAASVGLITFGRARLYALRRYPLEGWAIADQW